MQLRVLCVGVFRHGAHLPSIQWCVNAHLGAQEDTCGYWHSDMHCLGGGLLEIWRQNSWTGVTWTVGLFPPWISFYGLFTRYTDVFLNIIR